MSEPSVELRSPATLPTLHRASSSLVNVATSRSKTDPHPSDLNRDDRTGSHRRNQSSRVRTRDKIASQAHSYRQHARDTVQSAIELKPPISLDHLLRREKRGHNAGKQGSSSAAQPSQEESGNIISHEIPLEQAKWRIPVGPAELAKVRDTNVQREADLRESLKHVEDTAMSSIRELDTTYYAVLEKAATLRSTVSSLQRLSEESHRLNSDFKRESATLERQAAQSLDSLDGYNAQEQTINDLVAKLENAQSKRERLNKRLEHAQHRMEQFELRSKELSRVRRRQFRAIYMSVISLIILICALVFAKNRHYTGGHIAKTRPNGTLVESIASRVNGAATLPHASQKDPYLDKLFDRL
jgi:DNA repair exonuclease SbcCD ATPase subunit